MRKLKPSQAMCFAVAALVLGFAAAAGAQSSGQTAAGGSAVRSSDPSKVVMKVGNTQVTEGEFESLLGSASPQQVEQSGGKTAVGENYAKVLLLSQAALSQHLDSSPEFRQQIQAVRTNLLARMEYQDLVQKAAVTPDEVSQYFNSHQPEFKELKIYEVEVLKRTESNNNGLPETDARAKATAIRKAISSGENIKTVAKTYGAPNQVAIVSDPQAVQYKPTLPGFVRAAFTLPDGALSEIEERPDALLFFQVISHGQLTLDEAKQQIESQLKQQKVDDAVIGLRKQYPVWMDQTYFGGAGASATGSAH